ncbi:hypothetical protein ACGF12_22580 [Kitasatospora sp. NPDC048296]|uniref:hypothetical protein n=1 Tax=Kitasatospora sp. NPDC048296 TaxID=3364048 RepID=UPI00371215DC
MPTARTSAHSLARALSRNGLPAKAVDLSDDYSVEIELGVKITSPRHPSHRIFLLHPEHVPDYPAYFRLYLRPDYPGHVVLWMLTDAHGEVVDDGAWEVRTAPQTVRQHTRTTAVLREWLREEDAVATPPPVPPLERLIGEETNGWMWIFSTLAHRFAEALVGGLVSPDATPQDLARVYPDFTEEYDLLGPEGWDTGIDILRAFADGRVVEDHDRRLPGEYYITVGCDLVERYGPSAITRLQAGFGGDVVTAARIFLARRSH